MILTVQDTEPIHLNVDDTESTLQVEDSGASLNISAPDKVSLNATNDKTTLTVRENINIGGTGDYEELDNKPSINGVELVGDLSSEDLDISMFTDIGDIDLDPYDYDFWAYLDDNLFVDNGFYMFHDMADDFYYYLKVERTGDDVYQEWWCSEEGGLARNVRNGRCYDEEWDFFEPTWVIFGNTLDANFYNKTQVDNKLASKVDTDTLGNYYTDVQVDDILDNNYYDMDTVDAMFDGFAPNNMIPILWADLVELRDNGELTAGAYYRITDYNFVTTKASVRSGNHPFDIVVLAVSESMVSETAYACRHQGDTYFQREVTTGGIQWLYTMFVDAMEDNYGDILDHADDLHPSDEFVDDDVLPHPVSGDDVPVLYKTDIDEYDLDDPDYQDGFFYEGEYELDDETYDLWSKYEFDGRDWVFTSQYALTPIVVEDGELVVSPHQEVKTVPVNMNAWELKYCLDNDKTLYDWAIPEGKGVIYWMRDEFGNEACYDFKNVMFQRKRITATGHSNLNSLVGQYAGQSEYYKVTCGNDSKFYYTFVGSDPSADGSLFGECNYTRISPYILDGKRSLNDLVLYWAINSFVDQNCYNCTFLSGFRNTTLENSCNNLLITGCGSSVFGANSRFNTFVGFGGSTTGANFSQNIGAQTNDCVFGDMCQNNNLGISTNTNVFGTSCSNITMGNYCYGNKFGDSMSYVTMGNYCSYNTFEGQNTNIEFSNYYRYNTIELTCSKITLNTSGGNASQYVQYVRVCKGIKNFTRQPTRSLTYETIFYKSGRTETSV